MQFICRGLWAGYVHFYGRIPLIISGTIVDPLELLKKYNFDNRTRLDDDQCILICYRLLSLLTMKILLWYIIRDRRSPHEHPRATNYVYLKPGFICSKTLYPRLMYSKICKNMHFFFRFYCKTSHHLIGRTWWWKICF